MLNPKEQKIQKQVYKQLLSKKKELVAKYGKDAEKVAYGRSVSMAKNHSKKLDDKLKSKIKQAIQENPIMVKKPIIAPHIETGNESEMIKSDLYRIAKYAIELYQLVDSIPHTDLPYWWKSKIIQSKDMMISSKHFLDFELKEPKIDNILTK